MDVVEGRHGWGEAWVWEGRAGVWEFRPGPQVMMWKAHTVATLPSAGLTGAAFELGIKQMETNKICQAPFKTVAPPPCVLPLTMPLRVSRWTRTA